MGPIVDDIRRAVTAWPGVTTEPHRFGGLEFRVGRRELGHLHGDRWADLPFPRAVRDALVASGRAEPHHYLPDSGWVTRRTQRADQVAEIVALFRLNYDRRPPAGAETASVSGVHGHVEHES